MVDKNVPLNRPVRIHQNWLIEPFFEWLATEFEDEKFLLILPQTAARHIHGGSERIGAFVIIKKFKPFKKMIFGLGLGLAKIIFFEGKNNFNQFYRTATENYLVVFIVLKVCNIKSLESKLLY